MYNHSFSFSFLPPEFNPGHCGRSLYNSNETHIHIDPKTNINYTCFTANPIRMTACVSTCEANGTQWCCRNAVVKNATRDFECTANLDSNSNRIPENLLTKLITLKRIRTIKCECFPCSKIVCRSENDSRCPSADRDVQTTV